jgi:tetratricopeptide (TPR) repeat protein
MIHLCRLVLISLLIAVTTFLPSSNLIFTVGFVLAERNLYLPSIGFCLLTSYGFLRNPRTRKYLIFIVLVFYIRSIHRSFEWMSQESLFKSGLDVCPKNAKVHYNLGTMYAEEGDVRSAVEAYRHAIHLKPDYYQSLNNLGNILRSNGKMEEAEVALRKAVKIK